MVVVPVAAMLFGEKVGLFRAALIVTGFLAVLLILRPGLSGFSALSFLALAGMLGFAGRDLATRAAPPALSNAQLGVAGFAVLAFCGFGMLSVTGRVTWPNAQGLGLMAGASLFGIAGYGALTQAMRTGQVSAVTPFLYTRIVFALGVGMLVFGERPDALTLTGSALIVACGLILLLHRPQR